MWDDDRDLHIEFLKELKAKHLSLMPLELFSVIGEPLPTHLPTFVSPTLATGPPPSMGPWGNSYAGFPPAWGVQPGAFYGTPYAPNAPLPGWPGDIGATPTPAAYNGSPYVPAGPIPPGVPYSQASPTAAPFSPALNPNQPYPAPIPGQPPEDNTRGVPSQHIGQEVPGSRQHLEEELNKLKSRAGTPSFTGMTLGNSGSGDFDETTTVNPLLSGSADHPRLKWNMLFRPDNSQLTIINPQTHGPSLMERLSAPATSPSMSHLVLSSPLLPIPIEIKQDGVVTCGDVLRQIHNFTYKPVPRRLYDQQDRGAKRALSQAYYHNRRSTDLSVPGGAMDPGMRWIDWLKSRVFFGGIVSDDSVLGLPRAFKLLCITSEELNVMIDALSDSPGSLVQTERPQMVNTAPFAFSPSTSSPYIPTRRSTDSQRQRTGPEFPRHDSAPALPHVVAPIPSAPGGELEATNLLGLQIFSKEKPQLDDQLGDAVQTTKRAQEGQTGDVSSDKPSGPRDHHPPSLPYLLAPRESAESFVGQAHNEVQNGTLSVFPSELAIRTRRTYPLLSRGHSSLRIR